MKKREWLRWTTIVILLVVSLVLIFNQQIKYYLVGTYHPQVTKQTVQQNNAKEAKYDFSNVQDLNLQSVAKARARKQSINVIGVISVPAIKMSIPIGKGVDNNTLALAAGTMRADQKMGQGNYCLAGHNMDDNRSYFSPLYSTAANHNKLVGRKVYLMNYYTVYYYKIDKAYFIASNRTDLLNDNKGKKQISLFTCDFTGAGRLFVQGRYLRQQPLNLAPGSVRKAFQVK